MKIAVITGSRADWSGLDLCAEALKAAGHSVRVLGPITSQMTDDSLVDVAIASGEAFDCVWRELHGPLGHPDAPTDLVLLAGDRYEILAAAFACYMLRIPIAHIGGGDVTYGSADDAMRNAITALSSLHFVTHHGALDRLVNRLGVPGDRIHWTGSPALDRIRALPPAAFPPIGKLPARFNVLLAYHPDTIPQSEDHLGEILHACIDLSETWGDAIGFYISNPNADAGHLKVSQRLNLFANERSNNATVFGDMQPDAFVQLMRHCNVMIGNSSADLRSAIMRIVDDQCQPASDREAARRISDRRGRKARARSDRDGCRALL
jgi:UDP-N-acetylglucosamine 2-epimerase